MYPPEYQHLLDFLDSNPEYLQDMRTRLLLPDLIALPEQFSQLVGLVTDLSASFHDFAAADGAAPEGCFDVLGESGILKNREF